MVLNETKNNLNHGVDETSYETSLAQLALIPLWDEYSADLRYEAYSRQDEGLPLDLLPIFLFDDEESEEDEDMDEDESFDDMDDDFDDDFDDDEDDFDDEDEDYEDEDEDYDYEEDVDYDDFDE